MKKLLFTLVLVISCTSTFAQHQFLGQNISTIKKEVYQDNINYHNVVYLLDTPDSVFTFIYKEVNEEKLCNLYINKKNVVDKLYYIHIGDLDVLQPEFENLLASRKYIYEEDAEYPEYFYNGKYVSYGLTEIKISNDNPSEYIFYEIMILK